MPLSQLISIIKRGSWPSSNCPVNPKKWHLQRKNEQKRKWKKNIIENLFTFDGDMPSSTKFIAIISLFSLKLKQWYYLSTGWSLMSLLNLVNIGAGNGCCLTVPSHYINQYWFIINEVLWHSLEGNFTGNTHNIKLWIEFENYTYKNKTTHPRVQWVWYINVVCWEDPHLFKPHITK